MTTTTTTTTIAHVTLATRNVRQTSRFFEVTLGLRPLDRPSNIPFHAAWLAVAPGQEIHLIEVQDFAPSDFEREYGRHIAITYPQSGISKLKERLQEQGAQLVLPLRATPGGVERFFFRTPDGYLFEVIAEEEKP
jgi:catechol 2,3-dioxygenase-like lactoylglutathione lyase family enzyme